MFSRTRNIKGGRISTMSIAGVKKAESARVRLSWQGRPASQRVQEDADWLVQVGELRPTKRSAYDTNLLKYVACNRSRQRSILAR
jgi:hypothetical protein